jgi:bacillaene synthase trans-acting acyltransferase
MTEQHIPIVFLFSGQGSQYRRMGNKLYASNAVFRESINKSDAIVQQYLHRSLVEELYHKKEMKFDDLLITNPAIVAVEIAMTEMMKAGGITPQYVLGSSLGEFAAGVVSGIWDATTAIEASVELAKVMVRTNISGGMLAVIDQDKSMLSNVYQQYGLYLAGDNFKNHFTLSGSVENLDAFQIVLNDRKASYLRLPVNYPFHSPLIETAKQGFEYYVATIPAFRKANPGFISGVRGVEMNTLPGNYFWEVVSSYTDYAVAIRYLERKNSFLYIDLGPSGTCANFVKFNLDSGSGSKVFPLLTPFKNEEKQLAELYNTLAAVVN